MDVFTYSNLEGIRFKEQMNELGHEINYTFYADLSIAEFFGVSAIKDTCKNVLNSWGNNAGAYAEFVLALNHKIWEHYYNQSVLNLSKERADKLAKEYNALWEKYDKIGCDKFKGKDLELYLSILD